MKQKAFTLIELLVVIGIIGILSAIGVVSFGAVREKARRAACIATLRSNFNSDENLVAYWNFDESNGTQEFCTTIKDFWGNNGACMPNPAVNNAPKYTTNKGGIIDYGLSFDGVDDYIVSNSNLSIPMSYTFMEWVKGDLASQNPISNVYGLGWNAKVAIRHSTAANPLTGILIRNAADNAYYSIATVTNHLDNNWHLVAATVDRNTIPIQVKVYLGSADFLRKSTKKMKENLISSALKVISDGFQSGND